MFPEIDACVVEIPGIKGKGVIVSDYIVITAAHCLVYTGDIPHEEQRALIKIEEVNYELQFMAFDPIADIAALTFDHDTAEGFTDYCDKHSPALIDFTTTEITKVEFKSLQGSVKSKLVDQDPLKVWVRSHEEQWISGQLQRSPSPNLSTGQIKTEHPVLGGASGGPVLNLEGELLGVVSFSNQHSSDSSSVKSDHAQRNEDGGCEVTIARPSQALPKWLSDRIYNIQAKRGNE